VTKVCQLPRLRRPSLQAKEQSRTGSAYQDHDLIFPSVIGTPTARNTIDSRHLKPILARAGLPAISPHDLRHTCATLFFSQGANPKLVQELLGHSSVALTIDRYSHVLPGMGDQTAAAMDATLIDRDIG
jgi:integrase